MQMEVILEPARDGTVNDDDDGEHAAAANDDDDEEGYNNLRSPLLSAAAAAADTMGRRGKGSSRHSENADGETLFGKYET